MTTNATTSPADDGQDNVSADAEVNEAPRVATPQMQRRRVQQLNNEVGRLMSNLMGCLIIGWSSFNIVKNVRPLWTTGADGTSFLMTVGVILLLGVGPFLAGIWLLTGNRGGAKNGKK